MSQKITIGNVLDSIWENITTLRTKIGNATTSTSGLMSSTDKSKLDGVASNANKTTIVNNLTATTAGSALDATQGKALNDKIASFQTGVDALYNKCVSLGVTPSAKTLAAVTTALQSVYDTGKNTGYSSGYSAGVTAADNRVNTSSKSYTTGYSAGYSAGKSSASVKLKYVSNWSAGSMSFTSMQLMPVLAKQSDGTWLLDASTCVITTSSEPYGANRDLSRTFTTTTLS